MKNNQATDKTLVIGSSIIRDLDEQLYKDTEVIAISGGTPKDITKELQAKTEEHFSKVIIVAGGNQVKGDSKMVKGAAQDMKETLTTAKGLAKQVAVCELPPRINTDAEHTAIKELNRELQSLAQETDSDFITTKDIFTLENGEPNDGYLLDDGIHLSIRGSAKLVERLDINVKDPNRKVSKMAAYGKKNSEPTVAKPKETRGSGYAAAVRNFTPAKHTQGTKRPQRTPQIHKKELSAQKDKEQRQKESTGRGSPAPRTTPLCEENGFCGYCGEENHRYLTCRHDGPVECRDCKKRTHKAKFCHLYAK